MAEYGVECHEYPSCPDGEEVAGGDAEDYCNQDLDEEVDADGFHRGVVSYQLSAVSCQLILAQS